MSRIPLSLAVIWFLVVAVSPVQAYLDPGAGSLMLQVLLGGSAAVLVVLRLCWRRLLGLVMIGDKKKDCPLTHSR